MNTIIEQMLNKYTINNPIDEKNAIKEILQELILSSLSKAGFFNEAVFTGGTALRVFYKLRRFSEDLDFSLIRTNNLFDIKKYLLVAKEYMKEYGVNVEISIKNDYTDKLVKSAFLKTNTIEQLLLFNTSFDIKGINKNEQIKIKIEVDTNPPKYGNFEIKYGTSPDIYIIKIYDLPTLFSGKIHSILCRFWNNRVKGRDLYDYLFYISQNTNINIPFLEDAMKQTGHLNIDDSLNIDKIKLLLKNKFESIDYSLAKKDIYPFIKNNNEIQLWSKELFISSLEHII